MVLVVTLHFLASGFKGVKQGMMGWGDSGMGYHYKHNKTGISPKQDFTSHLTYGFFTQLCIGFHIASFIVYYPEDQDPGP